MTSPTLPSLSESPSRLCAFERDGEDIKCTHCGFRLERYPEGPFPYANCVPPRPVAPPAGAGTELKKLLGKIGIKATPNCKCNARARHMDMAGLQWCRDNIETISGWLAEESAARHLPYFPEAGKRLIQYSIYRASKAPGARP